MNLIEKSCAIEKPALPEKVSFSEKPPQRPEKSILIQKTLNESKQVSSKKIKF